jgi:putative ABC transport system permease protein
MFEWIQRLRDRFRRDTLGVELDEELAFHRAQLEREARHAGASEAEARAAAARQLGNVTAARELARERWGIPWLEHLVADVRYAVRGLRRSPGFTLTVIVTLGLGIGANATMFGVVDQLMFRPLAYLRDPARVHRVYWQWQSQGRRVTSLSSPYTRYLDLQREASSFAQLAAFQERNLPVGDGEETRELRVGLVSASYFAFFDAPPALGRYFTESEDVTPRGADVAVLSHAFWRSEFGGRDVLGMTLQVGNVRAQVIGVAPPGFAGVNDANPPAVWIPITTFAGSEGSEDARTYYTHYRWGWMHVLVRLKPDVTLARATADATQAFRRMWDTQRSDEPGLAPSQTALPVATISAVRPGAGPDPSLEARTAIWVLIVAAIVLVIAAANVTNLLVARALQRQRETAMRLALGAGTGRLVAQSVVESVILAALGAAAALLISRWASAAILVLLGATPEGTVRELVDWRSISLTFALSLVIGAVIGVVPTMLSRRGDLSQALRGGARGGVTDGRRVRSALLVLQGALSTVLLIGAVLFVRSLDRVRDMPLGYDAERVLIVNRVIRGPWPGTDGVKAITATLVAQARSLPQVEAAAWVVSAPFVSTSFVPVFVAGLDSTANLGDFYYQVSTPDYFRTMGTRILRGRALDAGDRMGAPDAAVVSESMARTLWPGREALGQCFRARADTVPCITVVGVAEDMVQREIVGSARLHYYLSLEQATRSLGNNMVVRVRGDASAQAETIRLALQRVLPANAYVTVRPLATLVNDAQRSWRLGATMFAAFGLLALVVAAVGLYGVIGYDVTQRMHELGVRVALGARRGHILRLVLGKGVRFVTAGVGIGVLAALYASRWVEPLLFRQRAVDPAVYAGVVALMLLVAIIASALPAARAAAADPATALRSD